MRKKITHKDIKPFTYPPINKMRRDLLKEGYSKESVDNIIAGLSELPGYKKEGLL